MKIANIWQRNPSNLLNDLRNFNELFRKDVTYNDIKSHKKPGFHPPFRRYLTPPSPSPQPFWVRNMVKQFLNDLFSDMLKDDLTLPVKVYLVPQTF